MTCPGPVLTIQGLRRWIDRMDYFPLSYLPELYGHGFTNQLLRLSHRLVAAGGKALANFIVGKFESMMIEFGAKFVFRVGREIARDQVVDYAERQGIDLADAEKNPAASLGYLRDIEKTDNAACQTKALVA